MSNSNNINNDRSICYIPKRHPGQVAPWIAFGSSREEYEKWIPHVCGVCCLKMAGDTLGLTKEQSLYDLTMACVSAGVFRLYADGEVDGAYHRPLAELAGRLGMPAVVIGQLTSDVIKDAVADGKIAILSVSLAKLTPDLKGGHLVLVYDYDEADDQFVLHDCSSLVRPDGCGVRISQSELNHISNAKGLVLG